jgi:hypothetical protein
MSLNVGIKKRFGPETGCSLPTFSHIGDLCTGNPFLKEKALFSCIDEEESYN